METMLAPGAPKFLSVPSRMIHARDSQGFCCAIGCKLNLGASYLLSEILRVTVVLAVFISSKEELPIVSSILDWPAQT